ncbi:MAG: hypothetical protein OXM57_15225 [bacterium]|nr:hypothetical protein [bacterium]MDE0354030.1 hypothetical protein [bacterium]
MNWWEELVHHPDELVGWATLGLTAIVVLAVIVGAMALLLDHPLACTGTAVVLLGLVLLWRLVGVPAGFLVLAVWGIWEAVKKRSGTEGGQ